MHQGKTGTLTSHLGVFDGGLTTAHEIGHVLGAQHGNKQSLLFFARGYQTKSGMLIYRSTFVFWVQIPIETSKDILIIGLLLNDSMLCKPKKTLYQS